MYHGILALVGRSMRVDARSWHSHLARFGLMVALFVALITALVSAGRVGAPGLRFFYSIGYLDLIFMTLLGISFFSTAITEEKEEDTLGLMLMAGISPLGILIGKSGGRLVQALLLIAVQYPFTLLAITMGGVTQTQVSAVYLALFAYMVLLAGFGLLCSTIGSSNRSAATWMIAGLSLYILVPMLASSLARWIQRSSSGLAWLEAVGHGLRVFSQLSIFEQMGWILTTGFGDPRISWQVISNLSVGVTCFGLAWLLFGRFSRQPSTEAVTRGLVARARSPFRFLAPGRPWSNPFLWKDFFFVSGGLGMIPIRIGFCVVLFFVVALLNPPMQRISAYQVFLSLAISIDAARAMAYSLNDEIRGQTLSSLTMLPHSTLYLIGSKLAGALIGWLPSVAIEVLVTFVTVEGRSNFRSICNESLGLFVTSFFILIPNLAALFSVYLRWGAVPLSVVACIGSYILCLSLLSSIAPFNPNSPIFFPMTIAVLAGCVACQVGAYFRLRQVAST
ncbi:MAG: ABC transporter permease subunit [Planctomycetes bacterium]|nr:ABC transporter permease subunit [Planctomycetota bacterium]